MTPPSDLSDILLKSIKKMLAIRPVILQMAHAQEADAFDLISRSRSGKAYQFTSTGFPFSIALVI